MRWQRREQLSAVKCSKNKKWKVWLSMIICLYLLYVLWLYKAYAAGAFVRPVTYAECQNGGWFTAGQETYDTVRFSLDVEEDFHTEQTRYPLDDLQLTLTDEAGMVVYQTSLADAYGQAYAFGEDVSLQDKPVKLEKGKRYRAAISAGSWTKISAAFTGEKAQLGGFYSVIAFCGLAVILVSALLVIKDNDRSFLVSYVILMILIAGMNNLVMKPFSVPDEEMHFGVCYRISHQLLHPDYITDFLSSFNYVTAYESGIARNDPQLSLMEDTYRFWTDWSSGNQPVRTVSHTMQGDANYATYEYLPQVLGILAADVLHLPWQMIYLLGRAGSLLCYLILTLLCMRLVPGLKYAVAAISLLPSVVWLAASFSYDAWNLGFSMLFICFCVYLAGKDRVGLPDLALLAVVFLLFVPIKYIYVVLGLMFFAIPLRKKTSRKLKISAAVMITTVLMIALAARGREVLELLSTMTDTRGHEQGLSGEPYTLGWVLQNPGQTFQILGKSLFRGSDVYLQKLFIGEQNNSYVPVLLTMITGFAAAFLLGEGLAEGDSSDKITADRISSRRRIRAVSGLTLVLGCLSVFGAFLLLYSYRNEGVIGIISGVQGRYFLPYMLLIPLALARKRQSVPESKTELTLNTEKDKLMLSVIAVTQVFILLERFTRILQS